MGTRLDHWTDGRAAESETISSQIMLRFRQFPTDMKKLRTQFVLRLSVAVPSFPSQNYHDALPSQTTFFLFTFFISLMYFHPLVSAFRSLKCCFILLNTESGDLSDRPSDVLNTMLEIPSLSNGVHINLFISFGVTETEFAKEPPIPKSADRKGNNHPKIGPNSLISAEQ
jgi:hypothetical protein